MCMSAKYETSKNIEKSERKYINEWMVDRLQYTHAMIGNISLYKKEHSHIEHDMCQTEKYLKLLHMIKIVKKSKRREWPNIWYPIWFKLHSFPFYI